MEPDPQHYVVLANHVAPLNRQRPWPLHAQLDILEVLHGAWEQG